MQQPIPGTIIPLVNSWPTKYIQIELIFKGYNSLLRIIKIHRFPLYLIGVNLDYVYLIIVWDFLKIGILVPPPDFKNYIIALGGGGGGHTGL